MDWARGIFRIWLVASVCWMAGATYVLWDDVSAKIVRLDQSAPPPPGKVGTIVVEAHWEKRLPAIAHVIIPPFLVLALGFAVGWAVRGFRPQEKSARGLDVEKLPRWEQSWEPSSKTEKD